VHFQCLSYAQVKHDFLRTSGNGKGTYISVQPLDLTTLTAASVRQTTKDLRRLSGAELERSRRLSLETGDGATKLQHSLVHIHFAALVEHSFEPRPSCFDLASHVCKLQTDDGMVNKALSKRLALVCILHGLFVTDTCVPHALNDDADTLVVEIGHDDAEAAVLAADHVGCGDFDIVEGDEGGAGGKHTLAVHLACGDAFSALDAKHGETVHAGLAGADGGGEVVGPDTVGYPFLLAVDDVVGSIRGFFGFTAQVGDVGTTI
jgi:hypothetical protein